MMNERIRQLAEQAGITTNLDTNYFERDIGKWLEYYSEKFAELIVEECVAQCWTVSESESKGSVVSECAKRIRKHFGVES
jgi:hypothetical protein